MTPPGVRSPTPSYTPPRAEGGGRGVAVQQGLWYVRLCAHSIFRMCLKGEGGVADLQPRVKERHDSHDQLAIVCVAVGSSQHRGQVHGIATGLRACGGVGCARLQGAVPSDRCTAVEKSVLAQWCAVTTEQSASGGRRVVGVEGSGRTDLRWLRPWSPGPRPGSPSLWQPGLCVPPSQPAGQPSRRWP